MATKYTKSFHRFIYESDIISFQNPMIMEIYYNYSVYTDLISFSVLGKQSKQEALGWN